MEIGSSIYCRDNVVLLRVQSAIQPQPMSHIESGVSTKRKQRMLSSDVYGETPTLTTLKHLALAEQFGLVEPVPNLALIVLLTASFG